MTKTIDDYTMLRPEDLDELLHHEMWQYDVEGIIKNATMVNPHTGHRYWTVYGDELDELIWFHRYERTVFHEVDDAPTAFCMKGVGSIIETVSDEQPLRYIPSNHENAELVVKAAEASILADDLYHLLVNHGINRESALMNTCNTMQALLEDMGFSLIA